ncbi:hypothetical protein AMST5_04239 [freshwater sediment metagenome]|jgi:hypothetical protein|uniref:Uncharacterized protein n=1 Tax=freshwater sediment metagenome TaxID=556182 RepID=A0AA48M6U7_9ZZZZ
MRVPKAVASVLRGRTVLIPLPPANDVGPLLVKTTIGTFVKFSLRTRNLDTAKAREAAVRGELQKIFSAAGSGPAKLSQRQIVALSGEIYRLFVEAFGEDPGKPEKWAAWKAFNRAAGEGRITSAPSTAPEPFDEVEAARERFGDDLTSGVNALPLGTTTAGLESRFGAAANWILAHHNLEVDTQTREALLKEIFRAAQDAGYQLKRNAAGDYRPDPQAERFPPFESRADVTLTELFERWSAEARPAPSTR